MYGQGLVAKSSDIKYLQKSVYRIVKMYKLKIPKKQGPYQQQNHTNVHCDLS